jgi:DNA-binding CsgD family transcriptional regulator
MPPRHLGLWFDRADRYRDAPWGWGLLLGREHELRRIEALLMRVREGCGAVVVLEGPAGIGKTALLGEAARRADSYGFSVLRAAGADLEREYPFGVVRHLFARVVARGRRSGDPFEDAARLAALPLGLSAGPIDRIESSAEAASAAMHGLYWLTSNLAEPAPLLLAVDDAHWADAMSQRFVLYLARRVEDLPVLLLVAARPPPEHGDNELLARLGTLEGVVRLRPEPLSESDVRELIAERDLRDADQRFVEACYDASGGNPFLLAELLTALVAEGATGSEEDARHVVGFAPEAIGRWVLARLEALGEDAKRLATASAVLGPGAPLADAALLAGLEPSDAAAAADALIGAHILAAGQGYEFAHPLVHAAVHEGLGRATRAEAHARAARLAAERGAPLPQVAAHLLTSDPGHDGWVVEVLRAAAREAIDSGAPASAASYPERALQEPRLPAARCELLLELAEAQLQAGLRGATERMREALELSTDSRRRAEICLALCRALFPTGDWPAARETLRCGLAEVSGENDDLALELRAWYMMLGRGGPPSVEAGRLGELLEGKRPAGSRIERLLLVQLAYEAARSCARDHEEVARLAHRALAGGVLRTDITTDLGPYSAACYALLFAGEPDAMIAELNRAIELSQRHGSLVAFGQLSRLRGTAHYYSGALLDALADLESARSTYGEGHERWLHVTLGLLALCLLERNDLAAATRMLELPGGSSFISYLYALGRVRAAQGKLREALDTLLECGHSVRVMNATNPAANLPWRSEAALLAARLGEQGRAVELVAEDLSRARAFGAPHALGVALRAAGLIEGANRGLEQLAEAVRVLDGSAFNLELARTLVEQGAALRRAGHRRDAREPLRRGLDLATRCGALALAARAREELRAAGARPRRERLTGVEALTASELRVARLAAQGLTNRQIAQALFVSMKTVSAHLGHVYSKLDVADRAELAAALPVAPTQLA